MNAKDLPAVILAAGKGKRLGELTQRTPKPLLDIGGRPLLEWILTGLRDAGIRRFLIVVGHLGLQIVEHVGDGSRLGISSEYVWQTGVHGTGAALRLGEVFCGSGPVLMSFGDILTDPEHYRLLLQSWLQRPCAAVMGINPMDDVRAGAAVIREGDRVVRIVEKPGPEDPVSRWNQAGVTVFGPEIWPVLRQVPLSPRGEVELTDAVGMLIAQGHEVRAVEFRGFWSDVGTVEALAYARSAWPLRA